MLKTTKKGFITVKDTIEQHAADLGLTTATDPKSAEYDLIKSLLAAADFRNTEDAVTEFEVQRNGKFFYAIHFKPVSEEEIREARKKATSYMKNRRARNIRRLKKSLTPVCSTAD